jgi:hypothetical protein
MAVFDTLEKARERAKVQAMAKALAEARRNSLAVRIPETFDDRTFVTISISLKLWDVLTALLEIVPALKLIAGAKAAATVSAEAIAASEAAAQAAATVGVSSKVTTALTAGEAISLAGPLVAYIGLWVGLGAPYLQVKQAIAEDRARRGVAHGVLIGAFGHSPERARGFLLRQNESANNNWVPGVVGVAQQSYRMGFIAGYKQGREMSQAQRKVFWKIFAKSLRKANARLWDNDWHGDGVWDNWFLEAGIVFMRYHLESPSHPIRDFANY